MVIRLRGDPCPQGATTGRCSVCILFVALADVLSLKREDSESKTVASIRSPQIHRAPNRPDMTTGEGFSSPLDHLQAVHLASKYHLRTLLTI